MNRIARSCVIACVMIILLVQHVFSGTIVGKIVEESGAPIPSATVILDPIHHMTTSDSIGVFAFTNLKEGVYFISIDRLGFARRTLFSLSITEDDTLRLEDIALKPLAVELPAVVVTANRTQQLASDVSQHMNVVSSEAIADRGAKTSADALREESGVFIQKTNQGGGNAIIRGYGASKVLLMVDGVRLNNSTYRAGNHQYLATVAPEMIEQIEVVHGPTSTQYGSDAFGGTVHLRSRSLLLSSDSLQLNGRLMSQASSADGERSGSAQISISGSAAAASVRAGYKEIGDVEQGTHFNRELSVLPAGENRQQHNAYISRDFDGKSLWSPSANIQLTAAMQLSRMPRVPRYDKYAFEDFFLWDYTNQDRKLGYVTVDMDHNNRVIQSTRTTFSMQKQSEGRETQGSPDDPITVERDETTTYGFSAEAHSKHESHEIVLGSDIYFDKVRSSRHEIDENTNDITTFNRGRYPDRSEYGTIGAFVQDGWQVSSPLRITAGIRYSLAWAVMPFPDDTALPTNLGRVKLTFSAITGSVGILHKLSRTLSLTSNLGQAFHAPNLNDLSRLGESKGLTFEVPNTNLVPERMNSIDIGLKYSTQNWQVSGAVFYNWVNDLIESADALYNGSPTITKGSVVYEVKAKSNIGRARIHGFELSASGHISQAFRVRGALSATRGVNITSDEPVGGVPPLVGLAGMQYLRGRYNTELFTRFAASQRRLSSDDRDDPRFPQGGTPGWYTVNLRGSYKAANWLWLRASVENIFDRLYREHGSGINSAGRNVTASVELKF